MQSRLLSLLSSLLLILSCPAIFELPFSHLLLVLLCLLLAVITTAPPNVMHKPHKTDDASAYLSPK